MSVAILKPKGRGACPTWFLANCVQAAQGGGYKEAGYHYALHVGSLQPYDVDADQWAVELDRLEQLLNFRFESEADCPAILAWVRRNTPRCYALVPAARRQRFLEGIFQALEDDRVDFSY